MEAQSDSHSPRHEDSAPLLGHSEIRTILSSLSHELSRPLVSLRMGFDLILGDSSRPVSPDQRGHLETMVVLCDDLIRLTRSYLDYAGMVQGSRPVAYGSFTVGALIREIDREFRAVAQARRIGWSCELEGPDFTVVTDASRCQQVFGNLVANALKYTPDGGEVRVAARREGSDWVVSVEDDGPGIPCDQIDRVFEPFYRLVRDEQPRVEGNGLGLAICRELVDQLGGSIQMLSTVGEGTRVFVRFHEDPRKRPVFSKRAR